MGVIICMSAVLGTMFEVVRWIRYRYKVNSQSRCKFFLIFVFIKPTLSKGNKEVGQHGNIYRFLKIKYTQMLTCLHTVAVGVYQNSNL